jgi:hypothetical protein
LLFFFLKLKTTWENINTTQNYQPTREDKIASYKEHQALKNKLNVKKYL